MEFVVTGEGDKSTPTRRQGKENLHCGVSPNLWVFKTTDVIKGARGGRGYGHWRQAAEVDWQLNANCQQVMGGTSSAWPIRWQSCYSFQIPTFTLFAYAIYTRDPFELPTWLFQLTLDHRFPTGNSLSFLFWDIQQNKMGKNKNRREIIG